MSEQKAPRVFVSHSSKDKDRFVLGFAKRLHEVAIDAMVDRWEMGAGDRLTEKTFEEGLGKADAVIAVVSEYSLESAWVKEELHTAKVLEIEERCRIIPVIIGRVENKQIPTILRSLIWVKVQDLQNYEAELEQVVAGIYGYTEKPPLGQPPAYVRSAIKTVPGFSKTDSLILKILGDLAIEQGEAKLPVSSEEIFDKARELDVGQERAEESLEVLADGGYVALSKVHDTDNSGILHAHPTEEGFETYLNSYFGGYEELARSVGYELVNHSGAAAPDSDELAERLDAPVAVVRHILRIFGRKGYAYISGINEGRIFVIEVKPRLRRWLEQ